MTPHYSSMKTLLTTLVLFASTALAADKCPISGKPADSSITATGKDGKTVAFCCNKCKAKFEKQNK
jgi:hypothetical protein